MMKPEFRQDGDLHLRDEDDYMELVENSDFRCDLCGSLHGTDDTEICRDIRGYRAFAVSGRLK